MEIVLLWGTQADLLSGYEQYGESLHDKVENALDVVKDNPSIAPLYKGRFHRKIVTRSPYALYYLIEGGRIPFFALLDQRQSPERIDERLGID